METNKTFSVTSIKNSRNIRPFQHGKVVSDKYNSKSEILPYSLVPKEFNSSTQITHRNK